MSKTTSNFGDFASKNVTPSVIKLGVIMDNDKIARMWINECTFPTISLLSQRYPSCRLLCDFVASDAILVSRKKEAESEP